MTVVIAKSFGDKIVILSDTMISDESTGRETAIPGRLKAIIVNERLSIAYAGHSDPALDAIRQTPDISANSGLQAVLEHLRNFTTSDRHSVDFIVASHLPGAELRRVWQGTISLPLSEAAIGNRAIERRLLEDGIDARRFGFSFIKAFTDRDVSLGNGVGGFPITLEASPDGHRYKGHYAEIKWKPIKPGGGTTYEDENDLLTGEWSFRVDILPPLQPGLAVLAAEVLQGKVGYVYAPLFEDDPERVTLLSGEKTYSQHQNEMHSVMRAALDVKIKQITTTKRST